MLDVYNSDGSPLTADQLCVQLDRICCSSPQPNTDPVGILTTQHRDSWARAYINLTEGELGHWHWAKARCTRDALTASAADLKTSNAGDTSVGLKMNDNMFVCVCVQIRPTRSRCQLFKGAFSQCVWMERCLECLRRHIAAVLLSRCCTEEAGGGTVATGGLTKHCRWPKHSTHTRFDYTPIVKYTFPQSLLRVFIMTIRTHSKALLKVIRWI